MLWSTKCEVLNKKICTKNLYKGGDVGWLRCPVEYSKTRKPIAREILRETRENRGGKFVETGVGTCGPRVHFTISPTTDEQTIKLTTGNSPGRKDWWFISAIFEDRYRAREWWREISWTALQIAHPQNYEFSPRFFIVISPSIDSHAIKATGAVKTNYAAVYFQCDI